jgi:uncharacterized protein (TIGR02246 family)
MLLALLLVAFSVSQTPPGSGAKDSDQKALERLEAEWNAAHVRGDATALERIFAEDLVVVVPGMRVMTKADSLGMFTSGRMKFERYETSEIRIRTYEDTAIVTGRLRRARVITGARAEDDWRFTKVYLHRGGRWQVVSFHASNANP